MNAVVLPPPAVRDEPLRRLPWVLAAAVLLVLAALLAAGHWLRGTPVLPPAPPPVQARFYELPSSPGMAPARPAPATPAPATPRPRVTPAPAPTPRVAKPAAPPRTAKPSTSGLVPMPKTKSPPRAAAPARPRIDWSRLNSDVRAAVAAASGGGNRPPQIQDPHSLTARFYVASLLRKLQEVGDLNYPGELVGLVVLDLEVDSSGRLLRVKLLQSSGKPALDRAAERIVRMSAPFAPFPPEMRRRTRKFEWVQYLSFIGNRQVYTW